MCIRDRHISRMENYVSSMSNIRRMEDTQPEYKLIDLQPVSYTHLDVYKRQIQANTYGGIYPEEIAALQRDYAAALDAAVLNTLRQ